MGSLKVKVIALSKGLGFRIAVSVGLILMASYTLLIYVLLDLQQDFHLRQVIREAERFSAGVLNATYHSMLSDNRDATQNIIRNMANQQEISDIRIYDHKGVIRFSNEPEELGTKVDKKAEACFACHSKDKPFSQVVTLKRTRIHHHEGHRVLGMITPIYNRKDCYGGACHAHPKEQKVLGILDMGMSLQAYDSHEHSLVMRIVLLIAGSCVLVLGTIGSYVAFRVHRPVTRLRDAATKVALGDFSYKLAIDGQDEIGQCARAFRFMSDQIRRRTKELIRSREEHKALFEQVPCFICVINRDFEVVRQNSYMRELFRG
ncbi:HAMP domain-containing protein, partial [Thermodesulfobacteriota bacterium]